MPDVSSAIINHILASSDYVTKVTITELFFHREDIGYKLATSVDFIDPDEDADDGTYDEKIVFNLPELTEHIFITVTDGDASRISRVIANLEQYERLGQSLSLASFISLEGDSYLEEHGKVGAIFIPVSDSYFLEKVPPVLTTSQGSKHLLYVVLVNQLESDLLHAHGFDALFDAWHEAGRGITGISDGLTD